LYGYFEDWLLVVAAYNSGPGHVLNAIKKSGSKSFWKLQYFLPKETRLHVKRFIATHYYFEGGGSLVTLGKAETENYLKKLEEFHAKNNSSDEQNDTNPSVAFSQWVAVVNQKDSLQLILKK
jgi:membrane-bound lytic murein transglycosylase D